MYIICSPGAIFDSAHAIQYYWRELPRVSFFHDKTCLVVTNACFSPQNMSFVVIKTCLLRQT